MIVDDPTVAAAREALAALMLALDGASVEAAGLWWRQLELVNRVLAAQEEAKHLDPAARVDLLVPLLAEAERFQADALLAKRQIDDFAAAVAQLDDQAALAPKEHESVLH